MEARRWPSGSSTVVYGWLSGGPGWFVSSSIVGWGDSVVVWGWFRGDLVVV
jgi:hypothetical protein